MKLKLPKIKRRESVESKDVFITSYFFSNLKKQYKMKEDQLKTEVIPEGTIEYEKELIKKEDRILNQKQLSDLYATDFSIVFDDLQTSLRESEKFQEISDKNQGNIQKVNKIYVSEGFENFNQTKYVNPLGMLEFYNKYSNFNSLYRKYPITKKTPSWVFIESSNKEKIIPNPLGLLRRSGQEKKLVISNQKRGDNYMKVLSDSLKYSKHLNQLELSGNRLSSLGASKLFKSLNLNKDLCYKLREINLSENKIGSNNIDELIEFINEPKILLNYVKQFQEILLIEFYL